MPNPINPNDLRLNPVQRAETRHVVVDDRYIHLPLPYEWSNSQLRDALQVFDHIRRIITLDDDAFVVQIPGGAPAEDRKRFMHQVNKLLGATFGRREGTGTGGA